MGTLALLGHLFGGFVEPGLQVQADRCLRASGSGCRECVDICPAGALRLGPSGSTEAPQSMLSQCTDCGLCAAACPSGAITGVGVSAGALTRGAERQSAAMRVVCAPARRERPSSEQGQSFSVSCLAALHPETVVATALALEPNSTLTLTRAQCSACPIAQQAQVQTVVQESVSLLQRLDDGGRQIVFESTSPDATDSQQRVTAQPNAAQHSAAGRRCWSRRELLTAGRSGGRAAPAPAVTSARGELLSHSADPSSVPMHLTHPIDARGCTFCHACAAVCPTEALQIGRLPADDSEPGDGPVRRVRSLRAGMRRELAHPRVRARDCGSRSGAGATYGRDRPGRTVQLPDLPAATRPGRAGGLSRLRVRQNARRRRPGSVVSLSLHQSRLHSCPGVTSGALASAESSCRASAPCRRRCGAQPRPERAACASTGPPGRGANLVCPRRAAGSRRPRPAPSSRSRCRPRGASQPVRPGRKWNRPGPSLVTVTQDNQGSKGPSACLPIPEATGCARRCTYQR